jgi:hypothetical protein
MNQSQLLQEIIKLSLIAEDLGCTPIQEELLSTANYLSEFIEESENYNRLQNLQLNK